MLHNAFDDRLDADYEDLVEPTRTEAIEHVKNATEFVIKIEAIITGNPLSL
jgi:uncharacterized protein (UPF0332 family)